MPTYFTARNVDEANIGLKKAHDANTTGFDAGMAKLFGTQAPRAPAVSAAKPAGPHASEGVSLSRKSERRFGR